MFHSNKGNFITFIYSQTEIFKKLHPFYIVVQFFNSQNIVSNFSVWFEVYIWEFSACNLKFFQSKFVVDFFTACCLFTFCSVRSKSKDKFTQILHFFFAFFSLVFCLALHNLAHLIPEIVVSCKWSDFPVVDITNTSTNCVQKVTVVANNNNCVWEVNQKLFKPCD